MPAPRAHNACQYTLVFPEKDEASSFHVRYIIVKQMCSPVCPLSSVSKPSESRCTFSQQGCMRYQESLGLEVRKVGIVSGSLSCTLHLTYVHLAHPFERYKGAKVWWRNNLYLLDSQAPLGERRSYMQTHTESYANSEMEGCSENSKVCQVQLKKLYPRRFPERDNI